MSEKERMQGRRVEGLNADNRGSFRKNIVDETDRIDPTELANRIDTFGGTDEIDSRIADLARRTLEETPSKDFGMHRSNTGEVANFGTPKKIPDATEQEIQDLDGRAA